MVPRERRAQIYQIALPIIGGMMSQNIVNLVDAAMVGQLGSTALAAVGLAGFLNFVAVSIFVGMSSGVQAMVSRRIGEGRESCAANPLNGALITILITALPLTYLLIHFSHPILSFFNSDVSVIKQGSAYLDTRLLSIMAVGMNFSFRGYLSAINMTKFYLKTLLVMHCINILLNYLLIFGKWGFPQMGAAGAGLGTTIAMFGGTFLYFYLTIKHTHHFGFGLHLPRKTTLIQMVKISLPSSTQQLFLALGFTTLFWIVGKIGTPELAAANVLTTLTLIAVLPSLGFGMGAATLVGKALGRKDINDAYRWAWDTTKIAASAISFISAPLLLIPELFLQIFLHEQAVIDMAIFPLRLVAVVIIIDAANLVLMSSLQGAGATKMTMIVSFISQWLLFLPLAWLIGPHMGMGLSAIWLAQAGYRIIQTLWFARVWHQRNWAKIQLC